MIKLKSKQKLRVVRAATSDGGHDRWLGARRALLARSKRQARALEGKDSADVRAYRARHDKGLRGKWRPSSKVELVEAIADADVVFGGDFHSLPQAQRAHLRVLRALPRGRTVVLGLEAFSVSSQRALNRFVRGEIDAAGLRQAAHWDRDWGFPWEGYAALAELAKVRGWRILALSPSFAAKSKARSLKARDAFAADVIAKARRARGGAETLIYALFGELHLAPEHLAKEVERTCPSARAVTVHVNSERIYFGLARRGLDASIDIAYLKNNKYCLVATPPWVQWQAHWVHLQRTIEQGLNSDDEDSYDYDDHVAELARLAAADLGVEAELQARGGFTDVAVFTAEDARIWSWLAQKARDLQAPLRDEAASMVAEGRSFYLPSKGVFYLSRATLNHASELAGQYVHAKLSQRTRPLLDMPRDFEAAIWRDAVGFFVSKLMNPQRRGETLLDARARLAALSPGDRGHEALLLALDQRMSELVAAHSAAGAGHGSHRTSIRSARQTRVRVRRSPRRKASWREAARILGAMMGERLYAALRSRSISLDGVVDLLRMSVDSPSFARKSYPALVRMLGPRFEPSEAKKERL